MTRLPPSKTGQFGGLILRLISLAAMVITIVVLSSNSITTEDDYSDSAKFSFKDIHAYRYMLSVAVIGAAYTIIQIAVTVARISTMLNNPNSDAAFAYFNFFGDKIASYLLATGTAAGFAVTKELQRLSNDWSAAFDKFFVKAYASAGLLLLGFICVALLSIAASMLKLNNSCYRIWYAGMD